jgi:hypothetical protein
VKHCSATDCPDPVTRHVRFADDGDRLYPYCDKHAAVVVRAFKVADVDPPFDALTMFLARSRQVAS